MGLLRDSPHRAIIFCDDLSFDHDDTSYKSLKAVLEGGIEGRPENVIFYATSNRRHLLPRDMMENERSTAINPHEAVEEKVSLSDRFGLWLGFHKCTQDEYLAMIDAYAGSLQAPSRAGIVARAGARMVDHARQPDGPRRLAVHPGPGGAHGAEARGLRCVPDKRKRRPPLPGQAAAAVNRPARVSLTPGGMRGWIGASRRLSSRDTWSDRPGWNPCAARNGAAAR